MRTGETAIAQGFIQQRYLEQWDGELPQFSAEGSSAPGILFNFPAPGAAKP